MAATSASIMYRGGVNWPAWLWRGSLSGVVTAAVQQRGWQCQAYGGSSVARMHCRSVGNG